MTLNFSEHHSKNQLIYSSRQGVELWLKREDLIHPIVSGNKFRKLKYNLREAQSAGCKTLVTFGGAFSNHIAAVAATGELYNFKTVGVIRGEELETNIQNNPTLQFANNKGMTFQFVSRSAYRQKTEPAFITTLQKQYPNCYILPEGGTNELAIKGCEEILTEQDSIFDIICCAVGTGGTIAGLINSAQNHQKILGFPALKGDFLTDEIRKFARRSNWQLVNDYHFGGYAKINDTLVAFINRSYKDFGIQLDPIYTGKMLYGIMDLINKEYFKSHTKILAIHTGGLQGISGMNIKLQASGLPLIKFE
jgi:1-aminocyclopropane-1-carboxylate deaminase